MGFDWQNSLNIFFVGLLIGGGSIYVAENSQGRVPTSTSDKKPMTPPEPSTDPSHLREKYQRQLAYLRSLRQERVGPSTDKVPAPAQRVGPAPRASHTHTEQDLDRRQSPDVHRDTSGNDNPANPKNTDHSQNRVVGPRHAATLQNRPSKTHGLQSVGVPKSVGVPSPDEPRLRDTPETGAHRDPKKENEIEAPPNEQTATLPQTERVLIPQSQSQKSSSGALPYYEVLHVINEFDSRRIYAEVLIPSLSRDMPLKKLKQIVKAIAEHERFDSMTVYRTRLARRAHYSMEFADGHPEALAEGLVGDYERGRFKPYKPRLP